MGTRGAFGIFKGGQTKATYNHYDSYPSGLGVELLESLSKHNIEALNKTFDNIVLVNGDVEPTDEQIAECLKIIDTNGDKDWYWLLRDTQGDLDAYVVKGLKYMIDGQNFLKDSLFCEWAYIINLDENVLEIYKGFQHEPDFNRYYDDALKDEEYKNCKLISKINLEDIFKLGNVAPETILKNKIGEDYY